jgi:hypothetical protein
MNPGIHLQPIAENQLIFCQGLNAAPQSSTIGMAYLRRRQKASLAQG